MKVSLLVSLAVILPGMAGSATAALYSQNFDIDDSTSLVDEQRPQRFRR